MMSYVAGLQVKILVDVASWYEIHLRPDACVWPGGALVKTMDLRLESR